MLDRETFAHRHSHLIMILLAGILGALITLTALYGFRGHTVAATTPAYADTPAVNVAEQVQSAFVDVAARTLPAVVNISAEHVEKPASGQDLNKLFKNFPFPFNFGPEQPQGQQGQQAQPEKTESLGSGWLYTSDGYIVTNWHVISGGTDIKVTLHDKPGDDTQYPAKVIGGDPRTELAVLKINAPRKLPTLTLGNSDNAKVGEFCMAVGAPFGFQQTFTSGVLSAKGRFIPGQSRKFRIGNILQTDAAINPGNSGGPLVDLKGHVIGINVAIVSPGVVPGNVGIGFAIPANTAKRIVPDLIKHGKVVRGWLGVTIEDLTPNMRKFYGAPNGGALVTSIQSAGPAAKSDLKDEDVVVSVNGHTVRDTWDLQQAVAETRPGDVVKLDVIRGKKPTEVSVKLGAMPEKYTGLPMAKSKAQTETAAALGLRVGQITPDMVKGLNLPETKGVVVLQVSPDSPAYGEIERGDVITKINNNQINNLDDYQKALEAAKKAKANFLIIVTERKTQDGEVMSSVVDITPQW